MKKPPKHIVRLFAGFLVLGSLWAGFILWVVWSYGPVDTTGENADVIVVLGCRVNPGGKPCGALTGRVRRGLALYRSGKAPRIYLAGGVGTNPPAESEVMKKILIGDGVPEKDIIIETKSHSTIEQAEFAGRSLLPENRSIILVTDFFHEWRATRLFRKRGFDVSRSPALESPLYVYTRYAVHSTLREALSLTKLFIIELLLAAAAWSAAAYLWTAISRKKTQKTV